MMRRPWLVQLSLLPTGVMIVIPDIRHDFYLSETNVEISDAYFFSQRAKD